jgi:hypothetical protein
MGDEAGNAWPASHESIELSSTTADWTFLLDHQHTC